MRCLSSPRPLLTEYEGLDVRLLSPMYIPALIGLTGTAYHFFYPNGGRRRFRPVLVVVLVGLLGANAWLDADYLAHPQIAYDRYVRYDMGTLRHSPTLQFVNTHPGMFAPGTSVYSNGPDLMYLLTSRSGADYPPDLHSASDIEDFKTDSGSYMVWLDACRAYPRPYLDTLRKYADLSLMYSFGDGAIYYHK
jgi:hypothetical protein